MKSGKLAVALAAVVLVAGISYAFLREKGAVAESWESASAATASSALVQVDELAESPGKYQGEIVLKAVVARVNRAKGVLSVIDFREFEACGEVGCARNYLPVKVEGELPEPKTVVELAGEVVRTEKGLVFQAKRLEAK